MVAEGRVFPEQVEYNALPWKYAPGTPDILGAIVSAQVLRLLLDLALTPRRPAYYGTGRPLDRAAVRAAMDRVAAWNRQLTSRALDGLGRGVGGVDRRERGQAEGEGADAAEQVGDARRAGRLLGDEGGHGDNRYTAAGLGSKSPNFPQQLEAVHSRHLNVGHH